MKSVSEWWRKTALLFYSRLLNTKLWASGMFILGINVAILLFYKDVYLYELIVLCDIWEKQISQDLDNPKISYNWTKVEWAIPKALICPTLTDCQRQGQQHSSSHLVLQRRFLHLVCAPSVYKWYLRQRWQYKW